MSLDETFTALADPTRRGVIGLLRQQPRRASDLADALGASRPAMSRHLRVLKASGLISDVADDERDQRERVYQLEPDPFAQLRGWLEEVEQFWGVQLDAFKAHVEGRATREPPRAPRPYAVPNVPGDRIADRPRRRRP